MLEKLQSVKSEVAKVVVGQEKDDRLASHRTFM